jgi:hypothetical protein
MMMMVMLNFVHCILSVFIWTTNYNTDILLNKDSSLY